jgi:formate dehydrogenase maturation protein FdhE
MNPNLQCSFCGKTKSQVYRILENTTNPNQGICSQCATWFKQVLANADPEEKVIYVGQPSRPSGPAAA